MNDILNTIKLYFYLHIILPIKRFYNYYIKGIYIEDNMKTEALFNYLIKLIKDPSYQPQGAYELLFEDELIKAHETVLNRVKNGEFKNIPSNIEINYQDERSNYAYEILLRMNEKYFIKED